MNGYPEAIKLLSAIGENDILKLWSKISTQQKELLLTAIASLDIDTLLLQKKALKQHQENPPSVKQVLPLKNSASSGSKHLQTLGSSLLAQGKVGCLLVAGGQGSRLGFEGPKGTFPISLICKKSLFQIFAEKSIAASKCYQASLPIAIMTSPKNHSATLSFFHEHQNFGLSDEQLFFFSQEELPFLNDSGHLILNEKFSFAKGPDGNGSSLKHFVKSGIWQKWKKRGIEHINYIQIDNPLADPFDAELVGYHAHNQCDITIKCVHRASPQENVGLLVEEKEGIRVIEYSEIAQQEREALTSNGELKYPYANISLFCFSMPLIANATKERAMPWHLTYKPTSKGMPRGWKFETFIFDAMESAQTIKSLLYPRKQCFAPLKNASGYDSPQNVSQALLNRDLSILESICGRPVPFCNIELDQQFYYPTPDLLKNWNNRHEEFEGYQNATGKASDPI